MKTFLLLILLSISAHARASRCSEISALLIDASSTASNASGAYAYLHVEMAAAMSKTQAYFSCGSANKLINNDGCDIEIARWSLLEEHLKELLSIKNQGALDAQSMIQKVEDSKCRLMNWEVTILKEAKAHIEEAKAHVAKSEKMIKARFQQINGLPCFQEKISLPQ